MNKDLTEFKSISNITTGLLAFQTPLLLSFAGVHKKSTQDSGLRLRNYHIEGQSDIEIYNEI